MDKEKRIDAATGTWPLWRRPEAAGWSSEMLTLVRNRAALMHTDAMMIVAGGRVVDAWGRIDAVLPVHSIRKSLLAALYGIHIVSGKIDAEATLGELGIDDRLGLTDREKRATVLELLAARSGVFHPAGHDTPWTASIRPARHSAGPGTQWCYNNWDANALGTIFRQSTGLEIHQDFYDRIASRTDMQDFDPARDGELVSHEESVHPSYPFRMSARDLAHFGELFLRRGRAHGVQLVPKSWVEESVSPISEAGLRGSYGYMWWVSRSGILFPGVLVPPGTYAAEGAGGDFVVVMPALDAVVVHRVDTSDPAAKRNVSGTKFGRLLRLVLSAAPQLRKG